MQSLDCMFRDTSQLYSARKPLVVVADTVKTREITVIFHLFMTQSAPQHPYTA